MKTRIRDLLNGDIDMFNLIKAGNYSKNLEDYNVKSKPVAIKLIEKLEKKENKTIYKVGTINFN